MSNAILNRTASISARLAALKDRKDRIERKIDDEQSRPAPDQIRLRQLKSRKLFLRDQMARYEGVLRTLKPLAGHVAARQAGQAPC